MNNMGSTDMEKRNPFRAEFIFNQQAGGRMPYVRRSGTGMGRGDFN